MIGKLTGHFGGNTPDGSVIIDVHGVGYSVRVSAALVNALAIHSEASSDPTSLFIHTNVREDAIELYGFLTESDMIFFRQLTSVGGVGSKTAMGIMNLADTPTLKRSIARGDTVSLTKVIGIGKKSAERIVVELKDKMNVEGDAAGQQDGDYEVVEALLSLGYSAQDARRAVKEQGVTSLSTANTTVSEKITRALQLLSGRA